MAQLVIMANCKALLLRFSGANVVHYIKRKSASD